MQRVYGYLDYSLYGYITDIMVWTNATLTFEQHGMACMGYSMLSPTAPTQTPFFNPHSIAGMIRMVERR